MSHTMKKISTPINEKHDNSFQAVFLKSMIAGFANSICMILTNPLDVLKIRFQMQGVGIAKMDRSSKTYKGIGHGLVVIVRQEGYRGLFKGLGISIFREMTFSSARMGLYEPIRDKMGELTKLSNSSISVKITAGLISGAIAAALFNPTDILKVRIQAHEGAKPEFRSLFHGFTVLAQEKGIKDGWYRAVHVTILRAALITSAQMASYDSFKHFLIERYNFKKDAFLTHLCASLFTGLVSTTVTNPVDMMRTRVFANAFSNSEEPYKKPLRSGLKAILRSEGILGLYKGWFASYVRIGSINAGVSGSNFFVLLEQLRILAGVGTI